MSYVIKVSYDMDREAYVARSEEIPGLDVVATSAIDLVQIVQDVAPELAGDQAAGAVLNFEFEPRAAQVPEAPETSSMWREARLV